MAYYKKTQLPAIIALITAEAITNLILYGNQPDWLDELLIYSQKNTVIWVDGPQTTFPNIINIRSNISSAITQLTCSTFRHGLHPVLLLSSQAVNEQTFAIKQAFILANYQFHPLQPQIITIPTDAAQLQKQLTNIQAQVSDSLLLICQTPLPFFINLPKSIRWAYCTEFPFNENATIIHLDYQMVVAQILHLINNPTVVSNTLQFTNLITDIHFDY